MYLFLGTCRCEAMRSFAAFYLDYNQKSWIIPTYFNDLKIHNAIIKISKNQIADKNIVIKLENPIEKANF